MRTTAAKYTRAPRRPWIPGTLLLVVIAGIGVALFVIQRTWGRVPLRVTLHEGDVIRYHATINQADVTTSPGFGDVYSKIGWEFDVQLRVSDVDAAGVATIDAAIHVLHAKTEHRPIDPSDFEYPTLHPTTDAAAPPIHARLRLERNGKSSILRDGERVGEPFRANVDASGVTTFSRDESLKLFLFDSVFALLPEVPVKLGDHWRSASTRDLRGFERRSRLVFWVAALDADVASARIDGDVTATRSKKGNYDTGDPNANALLEGFADAMSVERSSISGSERLSVHDGLALARSVREELVLSTKAPDSELEGQFKQTSSIVIERK